MILGGDGVGGIVANVITSVVYKGGVKKIGGGEMLSRCKVIREWVIRIGRSLQCIAKRRVKRGTGD
jgi:hypothetical protein